jgi:hypothetical protein
MKPLSAKAEAKKLSDKSEAKKLSDKSEAKLAKLRLKPEAERKPAVKRKPPEQGWRKTKKRREAGIKAYYKDLKLLLKHHQSALVPVPVEKTSYQVKVLQRQKDKLIKKINENVKAFAETPPLVMPVESADKKLNKKSKITPSMVLPEVADKRDELNPGVGQLFSKREKSLDISFQKLKELAYTELLIALTCCPWNFGQFVTYSPRELLMESTPQKAFIRTIEFIPISPYYKITLTVIDEDGLQYDTCPELNEIVGVVRTKTPSLTDISLKCSCNNISLGNTLSRYLTIADLCKAIEEAKTYSPANILSPKTLAMLKLLDKNGIIK